MTELERLQRYGIPMPQDHWIVKEWQKGLKPKKVHTTLPTVLESRHFHPEFLKWMR